MARALKVFRMPIGFHDAYVAAPSRKAALAAWGADRDLFARGIAEEVTDAELMAEPLASPGTVIRRSRGSAAEQMAALPADKKPKVRAKTTSRNLPKPDRAELEQAEQAIEDAAAYARKTTQAFDRRAATLARERREAERRQADDLARLEEMRDKAAAAYERAMAIWRDR
ncbi:hypothetical protein [Sphingomonas mollis]|uniref:Cell envelope biogenesis protein TolA n=1 Tax=Sphingomonas mollis TaxID=2795726 RepID=A0ABS0XKM5_9SPHN|nr:hypothetical protein [Sphingomonas sp. BT553]MBJ6120597.1 hypothetical protein [Sphingomonas sp. BT553]